MVCDKVVCVCVKDDVCERWCVTKLCVKDDVCERLCEKDGVGQSCV